MNCPEAPSMIEAGEQRKRPGLAKPRSLKEGPGQLVLSLRGEGAASWGWDVRSSAGLPGRGALPTCAAP